MRTSGSSCHVASDTYIQASPAQAAEAPTDTTGTKGKGPEAVTGLGCLPKPVLPIGRATGRLGMQVWKG